MIYNKLPHQSDHPIPVPDDEIQGFRPCGRPHAQHQTHPRLGSLHVELPCRQLRSLTHLKIRLLLRNLSLHATTIRVSPTLPADSAHHSTHASSCNFVNLVLERGDVNDLAANTITVLFFTHCITKSVYFAVRSKLFYRTLGIWNQPNSHPLFVESNNRYHALALKKMRRLLYIIIVWTSFSAIGRCGGCR